MHKNMIILIAFIVILIRPDCIMTSGTFVITYNIEAIQPSIGRMAPIYVDFSQDSNYREHKDNIESIDAISLVGQIANLYGENTSTDIWISDNNYSTEDSVRANGTLVFKTPVIPVGDTLNVDYAHGMSYIENIDALKSQIRSDGTFYLYGIADNPSLIAYHTTAVVTITAGL